MIPAMTTVKKRIGMTTCSLILLYSHLCGANSSRVQLSESMGGSSSLSLLGRNTARRARGSNWPSSGEFIPQFALSRVDDEYQNPFLSVHVHLDYDYNDNCSNSSSSVEEEHSTLATAPATPTALQQRKRGKLT